MSITELVSAIHVKDSISFSINSQFLNHNFQIVKQCLLRIKDLQGQISSNKTHSHSLQQKLHETIEKLQQKSAILGNHQQQIKELSNNVGDEFMKKMHGIEEKTRNMFDFEETTSRLQSLKKFVLVETFNERSKQVDTQIDEVWKLKDQLNRYVSKNSFQDYKKKQTQQAFAKQSQMKRLDEQMKKLQQKIKGLNVIVGGFKQQIKQNQQLIGDMNFTQLVDQIKKFKEEIGARVNELAGKLKKKVSLSELLALEKTMIEKIDKFLVDNERNKADKKETKQAFLFVQKKIHNIEEILAQKFPDQQKDALFTSKKVQCASCSKDLGKYEGRLGQYRPWSIFPCKQPDPEKSGGFGYLNYIDKMSYRKGFDLEDQNIQRLSKTIGESKDNKETPSKRFSSTRGTNLIQNFGSEEKVSSLKDSYFRQVISERGERGVSFRVKKEQVKGPIEESKQAQKK